MIGKRQHSSPIPENLACEISDATSQVRVSGNRRRGRLYNQPARHCPFSLTLSLSLTHSPPLIPSVSPSRSYRPFSFARGLYANSRLPRTVRRELSSRNLPKESWRQSGVPENCCQRDRAFAEISRAGSSGIRPGSARFAPGERETEVPMKGQRHISCARYAIITLKREYTDGHVYPETKGLFSRQRDRSRLHSQEERLRICAIFPPHTHTLTRAHIRTCIRIYTKRKYHAYAFM